METRTASSAAVSEVLNKDNYLVWSVQVRTYLIAQDLWDIVEATDECPKQEDDEAAFKAWSKKNAMALHVIQISCSQQICLVISLITSAKIAWETLEAICGIPKSEYVGMENYENSRFSRYASFEKHIREGEWDSANQFISSSPEDAVTAKISLLGNTALHIAIFEGHTNIVEELVKKMSEDNLKIKDAGGFTVLGYCAVVGNIQMAKCIIRKSRTLLSIGNQSDDLIPVVLALLLSPNETEMARYLYPETPLEDLMPRKGINGATFFTRAIYSKAIDMALNLLERCPELAIASDCYGQSPVEVLAGMSFAYRKIDQIYESKLLHHQSKKLLLRICQVLQGLNYQQLENGRVIEGMIKAVKEGRVEFVTEILKACPDLVWCAEKSTNRSFLSFAVLYRQDEVFRLLCRSPLKKALFASIDSDNNTILHFAAMLEPSARRNTVPGAAFLMQREVQWYKEVESIVHPFMLESTNKDRKRPRELFTESHKELVKEGEKWMKETASSCTVVAALIVTIMFAAAITVPGGNKQDSGLPTFLNEKVFMVFIISDALSLLSASTSLLMFLGTLTSRYAEKDFLKSLPKKMIVGLSTLILSIATMMITFCASLFIILPGKSRVVIPIICLAIVPVTLFAWTQFHLLIDMVISTYASRILDKKATYG
ncbi:hypothetical protein ACJW31_11G098100 [Castanea mollissima]